MPLTPWKIDVLEPKISKIEKENHETHIVVFHVNIQGCTRLGGYLLGIVDQRIHHGGMSPGMAIVMAATHQPTVGDLYYTYELSSV